MTVAADRVLLGIGEVATVAAGGFPRRGRRAMRELGLLRDAAIAVRAGRIVWIGPERQWRRAVRRVPSGRIEDLDGAVVLPGLVDAHTHALFAGDRADEIALKLDGASYPEIAARGGGIYATVRATRRASDAELVRSGAARLRRLLENGTTTAEVKSGYALTVPGERRLLELIPALARSSGVDLVPTYLAAHAVPPELARRPDVYVDRLIERGLPEVAARGLARYCDVFCEPGFFTARQAERLLREARRLGLGTKIHADEFRPSGGATIAARVGARSADHLLAAPAASYAALAAASVTAVLLPITPFAALTPRRSPGRELVDAGVPVALGSDLSPNSFVESMPLVLSHAVYGARLTPAEAIVAATANAAWAIGAEATAGQIAVGRPADLAVFRLRRATDVPYRFGTVPERVYRRGIPFFSRKSDRAFK